MRAFQFLFGFFIGLGAGWVIGTLLAPESGEEIQAKARAKLEAIAAEGRRAAEQRRAELEAQLAAMKAPRPAATPAAQG